MGFSIYSSQTKFTILIKVLNHNFELNLVQIIIIIIIIHVSLDFISQYLPLGWLYKYAPMSLLYVEGKVGTFVSDN